MTTVNFEGQTHNFPDDFTPTEISSALASLPKQVGQGEDFVKSIGGGLKSATESTLGMMGDVGSIVSAGAEKLGVPQGLRSKLGQMMRTNPVTAGFTGPTSEDIRKTIEPMTGPTYEPKTALGGYAKTGTELLPMLLGPGGMIRKGLGLAGATAGSEEAGRAARDMMPEAEPYARLGGAIAGGMLPGGLSRLITPLPAPQRLTEARNVLLNEGVTDFTAGQTTGRQGLKAFESEQGGQRAATLMENQAEQFTAAAARRAGIDSPRLTPDVMDGAFTRVGGTIEAIGNRSRLNADRALANDVARAQADHQYFAVPGARQTFDGAVNDVITVIQQNNGAIPGPQYNAIRSRLGAAARGATQDNQLRAAFYDLQHALDDAMTRSIVARGNAADAAALRNARNEYRNLLTLERAATTPGAAQRGGTITPANLRAAEISTQGRRGYNRGTGDFSALSHAGEQLMTPLPNSGTAQRTAARNMGISPAGAALGGTIGGFLGGTPVSTGIGAAIGGYTPRALGSAAVSGLGRWYLGNQGLANSMNNAPPWLQQALLSSLMLGPKLLGAR